MTRTTELLKEIEKIERKIKWTKKQHCDGCEPREMCDICKENFKEMRQPLKVIKSELKGRLDALKEEIKYLREFQKILNNNCIYQIEDRLASIRKEIKLIEDTIKT